MPLSPDLLKTIGSQHEQANANLRKVIGGGGKRQGNFFVILGKDTAALALTLSHKDPTANQVKAKGKKLRTTIKKVETTRFAQGTVTMEDGNWLTFTVLAGNARPTLIKQSFRDSKLWRELGFPKPDLLKRARVQGRVETSDGSVEEEVAASPEATAFDAEEIAEAGAYHFGELPDFGALFESAEEIEAANADVVAMLMRLEDDESPIRRTHDAIELRLMQGDDLSETVLELLPGTEDGISSSDLADLQQRVDALLDSGPQSNDVTELEHWLSVFESTGAELAQLPDPTDDDTSAAALSQHFVRRLHGRAINECYRMFEVLDDTVRGVDLAGATTTRTGYRWYKALDTASADLFTKDPDRLWDPVTIAEAEKDVLTFDENAPKKLDEWEAPAADAGRTRCPFLNLSANHGWIPRSGWATYAQIRKAIIARAGVDAAVADLLTGAAFKQVGVKGPDGTDMINIADLRYSIIFHPGGLAHDDDRTSAKTELVEEMIEVSADGEHLTEEDVKAAMRVRHDESGEVKLANMPLAFGETFLLFNLLAKEVDGFDEPVVHADDLREFLIHNRFPEGIKDKAIDPNDDDEGLVDAVLGIVGVAVDTYLPGLSNSVKDRVKRIRAERTVRDAIKVSAEGMTTIEIEALLSVSDYIQDLSDDEQAPAMEGVFAHLSEVGVLLRDPDEARWYPGDKLFPAES